MRKQPNSHNCAICGLLNEGGVRATFYDVVTEEGQAEVLARFVARSVHQGYPDRLHGGIAAGILDETIGRAINAANEDGDPTVWGVAIELSSRFLKPVPLDTPLTARGRITRDRRRVFEGTGEIYLPDGTVAVTAEALYARVPPEKVATVDPATLGWRSGG